MSLRQTHSNSVTFTIINEYGKGASVNTEPVFRPLCHVFEISESEYVKMPLFRREYFSLVVNVLTNSFKIFHVTMRDPFQLSYLHSDQ